MRRKIHKNNIVMVLTICFCFLAVGYAVLTQSLNIDGYSKVTGNWDIKFINITSSSSGGALNKVTATIDDTTATFNTTLNEPGDRMIYTITVKNNGNIDAIVESITLTDSTNDDINYSYNGIAQGNVLEANAVHKFNVVVEYDSNVTTVTKTSESATLTVNYVQKSGSNVAITETSPTVLSVYGIDIPITTSGDGLYADSYESGRYIFRGKNPRNYITFNNENWQILSIESDQTLKIVRATCLYSMLYDSNDNRDSATDTYCVEASSVGCSAWAKTSSLIDNTGNVPTIYKLYYPNNNPTSYQTTNSGVVTKDATINVYLNNSYFNNTLGDDKQYIVEHAFNVSSPGSNRDNEDISLNIVQEASYKWVGKVGLVTATEYMRATSENTCKTLSIAFNNSSKCSNRNWLRKTCRYWTISPSSHGTMRNWDIGTDGRLSDANYAISYNASALPVVHLDSTITLSGNGEIDNQYKIERKS